MDPATARVALKLQLDDVDAILKTLPQVSHDFIVNSERVAFAALRGELVRKWQEVHGRVYAHSIVRDENARQETYRKLLNEEQQAERDHDMACRLAGKAVPQRPQHPVVPSQPGVPRTVAAQRSVAINSNTTDDENFHVDLSGTQIAPTGASPQQGKKRSANDEPRPALAPSNFKRARVDDGEDEDKNSVTPSTHASTSNKRTAYVDPAVLREDEDGRTKRIKLDPEASGLPTDNTTAPLSSDTIGEPEHGRNIAKSGVIMSRTCSSCLERVPLRDMLQLPCKDKADIEAHAYCRDCLTRLFECSIADSSHFPPRCCSKIIPVFSCIPFLPSAVFSRFVAKREELETLDRTYCSNSTCSSWIRPANIAAGIATCVECVQNTCVTCKKKQHDGLCLEDEDVKKLMNVAKAKRWQTCPKCKEMVELERGCYHITCRCQYEFCYTCLAKWRTCECPLWDERRIVDRPIPVDRAAQNVANAANAVPPVPGFRAALIPANNPVPVHAPGANLHVQVAPVVQPVPLPFANPPAPGPAAPLNVQAGLPQAQPRRNRRKNRRTHVHAFERHYLSQGEDTECSHCGFADRWVNGCQGCDLQLCRLCTKYNH